MAVNWNERVFAKGDFAGIKYGEVIKSEKGRKLLRAMLEKVPGPDAAEGLKMWHIGFSKWVKESLDLYKEAPISGKSVESTTITLIAQQYAELEHRVRVLEEATFCGGDYEEINTTQEEDTMNA